MCILHSERKCNYFFFYIMSLICVFSICLQDMCVSPQISRRCQPPPLPPARNYSPAWLESQSVGSDSGGGTVGGGGGGKHKHLPPPAQRPPPIPRGYPNGGCGGGGGSANQSTQSSSSSSSCPYHHCGRRQASHDENASLLYRQPIAKWALKKLTYNEWAQLWTNCLWIIVMKTPQILPPTVSSQKP